MSIKLKPKCKQKSDYIASELSAIRKHLEKQYKPLDKHFYKVEVAIKPC